MKTKHYILYILIININLEPCVPCCVVVILVVCVGYSSSSSFSGSGSSQRSCASLRSVENFHPLISLAI